MSLDALFFSLTIALSFSRARKDLWHFHVLFFPRRIPNVQSSSLPSSGFFNSIFLEKKPF
jgi:hypothetical protein